MSIIRHIKILDWLGNLIKETNPLPVREFSFVDNNNSTEENLEADEPFVGEPTDVAQYGVIAIAVYSDVPSAVDGLQIQQRVGDGDGWHWVDNYTILGGSGKTYQVQPAVDQFRIVYTNGAAPTTDFHIRVILHPDYIKPSSHRIADPISEQDDAELVTNVNKALNPSGVFVNIGATGSGNLRTTDAENGLAISKGDVIGSSVIHKFGQNDAVGIAAYEDVWDYGGDYSYPADGTAPVSHIKSSSASDTEPIEVQGLDINGDLVVQTKTLEGTSLAQLVTPLWRVFRKKNVGTSDLVGNVDSVNSGDTIVYSRIQISYNQTLMALYTIPNGFTGYMLQGTNSLVGLARDYALNGRLSMRLYGGVFQVKKTFGLDTNGTSFIIMPFPVPAAIPAKTDIRVSAICISKQGGVNTTFDMVLVEN